MLIFGFINKDPRWPTNKSNTGQACPTVMAAGSRRRIKRIRLFSAIFSLNTGSMVVLKNEDCFINC